MSNATLFLKGVRKGMVKMPKTYLKPRKVKYGRKIPLSKLPASVRPEIKRYVDQTWTAETLDAAGSASFNFTMNNLAQGVNYNQRVGDKVFSKSFYIKGILEGSTGVNYANYRIDLIQDRQPAATNPGWTDIYLGGGATDKDNLNAVLNPNNRQRFRIMKTIKGPLLSYLESTTGPTSTPGVKHFKMFVKTNKFMRWNNTAASTPNDGVRYFLVGWSDLNANVPKAYVQVEHRYSDA